jgi:hypothetical protein
VLELEIERIRRCGKFQHANLSSNTHEKRGGLFVRPVVVIVVILAFLKEHLLAACNRAGDHNLPVLRTHIAWQIA